MDLNIDHVKFLFSIIGATTTIVVAIVTQIIVWVKFKTRIEEKVDTTEKKLEMKSEEISTIKKRQTDFLTYDIFENRQKKCQGEIFRTFALSENRVDKLAEKMEAQSTILVKIQVSLAEVATDMKHLISEKND